MLNDKKEYRIRILKDGPYLVSGHIPLSEKIIVPVGKAYEFKEGRTFPQSGEYALCRCGRSKNAPFCDGSHEKNHFSGTETACNNRYEDRAERIEGPGIDLLDDDRCAFARFCHRDRGDAWELTEDSGIDENRKEAIRAASECPSGRLTARDKTGKLIDPEHEPSVEILQDPETGSSGGIFVKGNITIESSKGHTYETRNRVVLCRCGKSRNKPFCDATHVTIKFSDKNEI